MGTCMSSRASNSAERKQEAAVEAFIDILLKDKKVNCTYVPDFLERDIYRNLIRLILGNLTEILQSVRIQILNHVITIQINPMEKEIEPTPET